MKKIFFSLFLMLAASLGTFANSFAGFQTTSSNKMGNQIYTQGLIQNTNNITLIETDATKHQYNINLTNGGTGTFQMGGVTFSYTNPEAGKTAYKTYDYYIQPNGVDREIIIPTESGEQVKIVLMEACAGILVNGVSRDFVAGDNILTATGSSIVLKNSSAKPKISAILSLNGGSTPTPDPSITEEAITVRLDPSSCSSWSTVYLWAWTNNGDVFNLWPGEIVGVDNDGWYSYTFDASITSVSIIWNNGEGDKTVDITDVTSSTCYALNSTIGTAITISVVDCSSASSQGGTPVSGKYKIGDLYYNLYSPNGTASVTYEILDSWENYDGVYAVNIPSTVIYQGTTYVVTSIESKAFSRSDITSVIIPNSVTNIGQYAFYSCSSLTSLTIPNSVTSIGESAFYDCTYLTSVTIPNSVTSIGDHAFHRCSSLTSVTIGNSVTSIGDYAFEYCSGLTSVTIPNSVTSIGEAAFEYCSGLTSVTIPNSVTSIGEAAFEYCSGLTSPVYNAHVFAFMPTSYSGAFTIPDGIESIAGGAFSGCSSLTSVTIPNSVTSIGDNAFSNCSGLTSPVYNAHVFASMPILYSGAYTIPDGIESIAGGAFSGCTGLTSITIPESVTSIGNRAFSGCSSLTSVTIPHSVTSIGGWAFSYCSGLTSVTIEAGTPPTIGEYCFYYYDYNYGSTDPLNISVYVPCGSLEAYQAAVGWSDYASKIKYAPYPYTINKKAENGYITTSSTDIFTMCDTEHPVICTANPNRGFYFSRWADGSTENPRTIELTQDTTMEAIFDYLLTGKCGKDSVLIWTLDKTTMELNITGSGALSDIYTYTYDIESVTIGDEVTSIGSSAFYGFNKLQNVILGSAVKILEYSAFNDCSAIETITCYSQRPPTVNESALYGVDYSTIVYVPADYLEIYKMHDAWGLYDVRPLTTPEAIEDIISDKKSSNSIRKILHNGQFFILRGEKIYTLQGQEVK